MKIKIKKIHAIGVWSWVKSGGEDERCAVCQNPLDGCAPGSSFPGDDSPVVWGKCNHAFHLQCINKKSQMLQHYLEYHLKYLTHYDV